MDRASRWSRRVDRAAIRRLERGRRLAGRWARRGGRRLRPPAARLFRGLAWLERHAVAAWAVAARAAKRAWREVTPPRVACAVVLGAAACLLVSQFVEYRAVEIGQPAYAGLPAAAPPTTAARTAGEAHAYLLAPLALVAAALGALALRRRRRGLGRLVAALGLLALAVVLLVDLPAGLDAGAASSRFAGTRAVLESGFYLELFAAAGLIVGGLLYYARPCRIRISLSGRAASALRRRRPRRASSRDRGARSASPPRSGAASARASRP
jgi:hypothetical protein